MAFRFFFPGPITAGPRAEVGACDEINGVFCVPLLPPSTLCHFPPSQVMAELEEITPECFRRMKEVQAHVCVELPYDR